MHTTNSMDFCLYLFKKNIQIMYMNAHASLENNKKGQESSDKTSHTK